MATKPDEVTVLDVKLKHLFITCGRTISVLESNEDIKRLENWQDEYKQNKESIARKEQLKFEIRLHETKLQLQSKQSTKMSVKQPIEVEKEVAVKLPKLVISKFDGSFTDWNRFWGQFREIFVPKRAARRQSTT